MYKAKNNFNLIFDQMAIKKAVKYLEKHNLGYSATYDSIYDYILKLADKNAGYVIKDTSDDGKWEKEYTDTGGFMLLSQLIEYTKSEIPIIQVDVYVTPNIGEYKFKQIKVRKL